MNILVTGGAGYIGSHTAIELIAADHDVVLLDNFSNSSPAALPAMRAIANREVPIEECDVRDADRLDDIFARNDFNAVIHFAALKAVGESVAQPLRYHDNNVAGTACLLDRMATHGVKTLVFSSSAAVYGDAATPPISEACPTEPASPYARTKLVVEDMLRELHTADPEWRISILRYFNAVGAHPSGDLGENPTGVPANLLPFVAQVAMARREYLGIFGNDYPTPDGTGVRDYLHVVDLARGHLKALDHLAKKPGVSLHNLGTGRGRSVLEVVRAFESASGRTVPCRVVARRPGDIAASWADPSKAREELGWTPAYDLDRICVDLWRWQRTHPDGFDEGALE